MSTPVNPDAVSSEELPDDWINKKSDAVKEVLEEMTTVYNLDGERIPLKFKEQSYCDKDRDHIAINPLFWKEVDPPVDGPNILRVLDDILAHEVSHYNWSDLKSKEAFNEEYPEWGEIPGHVANILEDEYVDARRMRKWYGMRSKRAYRVMLQAETEDITPDVSEVFESHGEVNAFLSALHQIALYGTARGLADAPYNLVEFCSYCEPVVERIRRQNDPDERFKLFHVVMELLKRYVEKPEDFDDEEFEAGTGKAVSGKHGHEEEGESETGDADVDHEVPDDVEDMVDDIVEDLEPEDMDMSESESPDTDTVIDTEMSETEESGVTSDDEDGPDDGGGGADTETTDETADDGTDVSTTGAGDKDINSDDSADDESDIMDEHGEHHIEPDEMMDKELVDGVEERYDVDIDEIKKVDERDRERWAGLVRQLQEYDLDIEERKRERDKRIEDNRERWSGYSSSRRSEALRERAEDAGVIRDLKEGFEELVSRNVPKPARRGTRIDPYNVARRASGDMTVTELFEEEQVVETGDRCVGFATDISGSMGSGIDELKIAGAAVAKATEIIGDEFVWEAFTDRKCPPEESAPEGRLDLRVVTGPDEEFDWRHVDSFMACANEPTAAGIRDCFKLMKQTDANEYVMIVVTDGVALVEEDGKLNRAGNTPVEHAREAVNEVRANGVDVIGLGMGDMDDRKMEETFGGNNYRLTNIDRLADDILELYREQMNTVQMRR